MLILWIVLSLIVGFVLGHFIWTKTITKIETVYKEVVVPSEPIVTKPDDYDEYLKWKEHKEDWINLSKLIPDVEIQDDEKFDRIMQVIEKELSITDNGEFGTRINKRKKKKNN